MPLALAALLFAAIGEGALRHHGARAIVFMTWAELLLGGALGSDWTTSRRWSPGRVSFPLMAACAIALAARATGGSGSPPCWSAFPRSGFGAGVSLSQ